MSIRTLKLVANAGDPDDILTLRIDVVAAAVALAKKFDAEVRAKSPLPDTDEEEERLYRITKRYMRAVKRRSRP